MRCSRRLSSTRGVPTLAVNNMYIGILFLPSPSAAFGPRHFSVRVPFVRPSGRWQVINRTAYTCAGTHVFPDCSPTHADRPAQNDSGYLSDGHGHPASAFRLSPTTITLRSTVVVVSRAASVFCPTGAKRSLTERIASQRAHHARTLRTRRRPDPRLRGRFRRRGRHQR